MTSDKVQSCTGEGGEKGQWKCKWERLEIDSSELEQLLVQSREEGEGREECVCVLEKCVYVRRVWREEEEQCVCVCEVCLSSALALSLFLFAQCNLSSHD